MIRQEYWSSTRVSNKVDAYLDYSTADHRGRMIFPPLAIDGKRVPIRKAPPLLDEDRADILAMVESAHHAA